MKSIKQQYIDLREGNMTQANFMSNLRMTLPQYVTNVTSFEDSVRILKNKGILTDADTKEGLYNSYADVVNAITKKYSYKVYHDEIEEFMKDKASLEAIMAGKDPIVAYEEFYNIQRESLNEAKDSSEGKWKTVTGKDLYAHFKEIDNLNAQEVLIGIDYEMIKNPELTKSAAAKIVVKNLKKNPIYYTAEDMSGVEGYEPEYMGGKSAQPEAHQMQYLDKNMGNVVDKKRGMQPVKGVEKAKKDSDKGGETNKAVKGIDLMSLIAKTVRGMKKMDATGEKMKKIVMKEGMEGQYTFNGYFKGGELDRLMTMIPDAEIDNQVEFGQGAKTTIFSQQHSDEEIKKAVNSVIGMNEDKSKVNLNNLTMSDAAKRAKKIHDEEEKKRKERNSKLTKESLMNMIREELKEMMDGMEPMSREDGSSYTNN